MRQFELEWHKSTKEVKQTKETNSSVSFLMTKGNLGPQETWIEDCGLPAEWIKPSTHHTILAIGYCFRPGFDEGKAATKARS
jgi:hypothetical protein